MERVTKVTHGQACTRDTTKLLNTLYSVTQQAIQNCQLIKVYPEQVILINGVYGCCTGPNNLNSKENEVCPDSSSLCILQTAYLSANIGREVKLICLPSDSGHGGQGVTLN